ncbi:MAG TPA: hypothetical protein PLJ49_07550, partial [Smithella sp.]|nr:hypothetical protein [Smithella sp.]
PKPHPFKEALKKKKIKLWQLRKICGVPESQLSRYMNGIDIMPRELESLLEAIIYQGYEDGK